MVLFRIHNIQVFSQEIMCNAMLCPNPVQRWRTMNTKSNSRIIYAPLMVCFQVFSTEKQDWYNLYWLNYISTLKSYFILEIDGRKGFLRHLEKMFSAMIPITRSRISTNVLKGKTMVNLDGTLSSTRTFTCRETCTQILVTFYLFCVHLIYICNLRKIRMCSRRSRTQNSLILMTFHLNGLA